MRVSALTSVICRTCPSMLGMPTREKLPGGDGPRVRDPRRSARAQDRLRPRNKSTYRPLALPSDERSSASPVLIGAPRRRIGLRVVRARLRGSLFPATSGSKRTRKHMRPQGREGVRVLLQNRPCDPASVLPAGASSSLHLHIPPINNLSISCVSARWSIADVQFSVPCHDPIASSSLARIVIVRPGIRISVLSAAEGKLTKRSFAHSSTTQKRKRTAETRESRSRGPRAFSTCRVRRGGIRSTW